MANILVVDDEAIARFSIRDTLESAGHSVVEAADGKDAIERLTTDPFDLVITDIIMPKREGLEIIIEMKRDYPELKIIAISGGGRTKNLDFLELAEKFGADRVIAKPSSKAELMENGNACLDA
jgi:CheY-like chemotaxis protein